MAHYDAFSKKTRRLKSYDYRLAGLYFITICTKDRANFFGKVLNGKMVLSAAGQIAHEYWLEIGKHGPRVWLGDFVVMPNHVHGIIGLEGDIDRLAELDKPRTAQPKIVESLLEGNHYMAALTPKAGSISQIIGSYKTACTKRIRNLSAEPFGWQPRFHDRIIRNQRELETIEHYILNNPSKWQEDQFYKT